MVSGGSTVCPWPTHRALDDYGRSPTSSRGSRPHTPHGRLCPPPVWETDTGARRLTLRPSPAVPGWRGPRPAPRRWAGRWTCRSWATRLRGTTQRLTGPGHRGDEPPTATPRSAAMVRPLTVRPRFSAGKSVVPELPPEFVPRERLRRALDQADDGQVVLLSAPAGYGKTLLLADWVRSDAGRPTGWVSVDSDDNDPRRFWSAVITSLLAAAPTAGLAALAESTAFPSPAGDVDVVEELADVLENLDQPV